MGLEFCSGLLGAFANFKSVFFVLAVAALSSSRALQGRRLVTNVLCFVIVFTAGVVWTAVKTDYRSFLADQTLSDDLAPPAARRFEKLGDLVQSLNTNDLSDGIEGMIMRVSYVRFFALSIVNVPTNVSYEGGRLWGGAITHVLTPRVLFPEKEHLDDSERTRLYTGIQVSGVEQNTSIGIGYVGESYIDFGPVIMFVPIFALGLVYGLIYRVFVIRTRHAIIGSALAVACLIFNAYEIERSNIKMVGGVVIVTMASAMFYKAFGATLWEMLRSRTRSGSS